MEIGLSHRRSCSHDVALSSRSVFHHRYSIAELFARSLECKTRLTGLFAKSATTRRALVTYIRQQWGSMSMHHANRDLLPAEQ